MKRTKRYQFRTLFNTSAIVLIFIMISLFYRWEPTHETWGYWAFSRIWSETGTHIIADRSPLYTIYLSLFRLLEFPWSVISEYICTTFITVIVLIFFSRNYIALPFAVMMGILWIPFFQISEPPVQKLAFASVLLGFLIRIKGRFPLNISYSYTLFYLAYLFRSIYLFTIIIFLIHDIYNYRKKIDIIKAKHIIKNYTVLFPFLFLMMLSMYFRLHQSDHPWNNGWFATSKWFPYEGKKFEIIQVANWSYIWQTYGTFKNHDFYFTNNDLFHGATTSLQALFQNPTFILKFLLNNFEETIANASFLGLIPTVYSKLLPQSTTSLLNYILLSILLVTAWKGVIGKHEKLFILSFIFQIFIIVIFKGFTRYLYPVVIFQLFSLVYMLEKMKTLDSKKFLIFGFVLVSIFSNGLILWRRIAIIIFDGIKNNDLTILENKIDGHNYSLHKSFTEIKNFTKGCNGIMTLEYTFVASFTNIPLKNLYDVWEIPPFGSYEQSIYSGLRKNRINCLLISNDLMEGYGAATNYQLRFDNYLLPYENTLLRSGANYKQTPEYGKYIILSDKN